MNNTECTHHTQQREGPRVAPGSSPGDGGCTDQNRHQLRRSAWYTRSKRLILISLIAATAITAAATQSNQVTGSSTDSISLTTCVALDADSLAKLIVGVSLFVLPLILLCLLIWHGFILPRIDLHAERWVSKQLAKDREGT